jgi:hypothetical protein
MKRWLLVVSACALASGLVLAQAPAGAPPKPTPEHARLSYFVGKWKS